MTTSPTVWRRWLAQELLRLRLTAGLDRTRVAKAIRCTPQKIGHIETATVPPKVIDLEEIFLPMYGVPEERWPFYVQAARDARKKGWWESHSAALPDWFSLYIGLEQGATQLQKWDPQLVHGLLQTRAYMTALLGVGGDLPAEELERRVELRLARQSILEGPDPLRLVLVLAEDALHTNIGGPEVMREQLEHLVKMARKRRITVQVLPRGLGAHAGFQGPFTILDFATEDDPGVVYLEHRAGAVYLEHSAEVKTHRIALEDLRGMALSPTASIELITRTAEGIP